jgi:hypothetical protein
MGLDPGSRFFCFGALKKAGSRIKSGKTKTAYRSANAHQSRRQNQKNHPVMAVTRNRAAAGLILSSSDTVSEQSTGDDR